MTRDRLSQCPQLGFVSGPPRWRVTVAKGAAQPARANGMRLRVEVQVYASDRDYYEYRDRHGDRDRRLTADSSRFGGRRPCPT